MNCRFHRFIWLFLFVTSFNIYSLQEAKTEENIVPEEPATIEEELKESEEQVQKEAKDEKVTFTFSGGKNKVGLAFRNRTEAFYGRSIELFSPSPLDQVVYAQYTFDFKFDSNLGDFLKSLVVLRHKSRWGNPNTIARTTENTIRLADDVTGKHKHFLGKQIFWMREGWIDICLNEAFCIRKEKDDNKHYLTLGAFSFRLGRGIALGDAYAVSPGLLGFYSNNVVDQYAPAILLHGQTTKKKMHYDIYLAILENLSDSFENVNEEIYAMQMCRRRCPQRGFGKLNYVLAGRFVIDVLKPEKCNGKKSTVEPYILYNFNPEQMVEFPSDANSKLITWGLAFEYEGPKFEFGFDFAQNFGRQFVKPWDRNRILTVRNGQTAALTLEYSKVVTQKPEIGKKLPPRALVTDANKKIVNESVQSIDCNGEQIDESGLYNALDRFRDGYKNIYAGFMCVADASYRVNDKFRVVSTFGYASGDSDPNVDLDRLRESEIPDKDYKGFIGLQEIYQGKRLYSVFVLDKPIPRPLSVPSNDIPEEDRFAQNVSNFTNLIYCGFGCEWAPKVCNKQFNIKPGFLAYWQEFPSRKFELRERTPTANDPRRFIPGPTNEDASNFLGVEFNMFADVRLSPNLKSFLVIGFFRPGQHYKDSQGAPLKASQVAALKELNDTGFNRAPVPLLGKHLATSLNWGFEYTF